MNQIKIDELDRQVMAALLAHPRASVAEIGRAVASSEATVSRRLTRLLRTRLVRIIGVLDMEASHRARSVFVRLTCRPGTSQRVADELAGWGEARSVKMLTGSVDCVMELVYTSNEHLHRLMIEELPRLDGVIATSSMQVIRRFATPHGWNPAILPEYTIQQLRDSRLDHWDERTYPDAQVALSGLDERLVALLAGNGRLALQDLARQCDVMPSTARRHLDSLMARGLLRMRTVVEPAVLGLPVDAFVWLGVNPTELGMAGQILARHPAVIMIAATAGDRNLCGEIAVGSDSALYEFLADTIGKLPGLQHAELSMGLRTVKRAAMPTARPLVGDDGPAQSR
jgi:DNA-binding Lrp family transcriptional regulator